MDTSETYVEMCRAAMEVQEMWKPALGDFAAYDFGTDGSYMCHALIQVKHPTLHKSEYVWLPRQDQLQEMVDFAWREGMTTVGCCAEWDEYKQYKSPEQVWIAFVMKERYNKTWVDGEWYEQT